MKSKKSYSIAQESLVYSVFCSNLYGKRILKRRDLCICMGFPGGLDGKASACSVGDPGSIPGLGRSLGEGHGNPL